MTKLQIIEFAASFGYEIKDAKSAQYIISRIRQNTGIKSVSARDVYNAWRA